jgi:serine/threonine-protein kinase RsbW
MTAEHPVPGTLRLVFPATETEVRKALGVLTSAGPLCDLPSAAIETAELVIVEVLNNIVEHAYAQSSGEIEVRLGHDGPHILVEIIDTGQPLPGLSLPLPKLPDTSDLPEGGFGWYLIRTLASDVTYRRAGGRNMLRLCLPACPVD